MSAVSTLTKADDEAIAEVTKQSFEDNDVPKCNLGTREHDEITL
jgi:hypothetical protein